MGRYIIMLRRYYNYIFANDDEVTDIDTTAFSQGSIFNNSWFDFNSHDNLEISDDSATAYFDALSDTDFEKIEPLPLNCDLTRNKWHTLNMSEMKKLCHNTLFQNRMKNVNETKKLNDEDLLRGIVNDHNTAYIAMTEKVQEENVMKGMYQPFEIFTDLDDPDQDDSDLDDLDQDDYEIR